MIDSSTIGPVEMLAVGFPGSQFKGEILPELKHLADRGLIRVLDLVVVTKANDGSVRTFEATQLSDEAQDALSTLAEDLVPDGLLGEEDFELAAEVLEPGSSAALLVWEDRWAAPIANAIRKAGGTLLAYERVPREAVEEVIEAVNAAQNGG